MKKTLLLAILIAITSTLSLNALTKVGYITFAKTTMVATATTSANDPIIQTLSAIQILQLQ